MANGEVPRYDQANDSAVKVPYFERAFVGGALYYDYSQQTSAPQYETEVKGSIISTISRAGGVMHLGYLLDSMKKNHETEGLDNVLCELWQLNQQNRVMVLEDTDAMRITVELHENRGNA
jgi:hypothetical protein